MSKTVWLTGPPCSGKTTLAYALAGELRRRRRCVCVLDGDEVRKGLCADLGFSEAAREQNARRVAAVAALLADADIVPIVALVSPTRASREAARRQLRGRVRFVYVSTPASVCEERDTKGLYAEARAGLITRFTGVDAPYEVPERPDLALDTSVHNLDVCVEALLALVNPLAMVSP